MSSPPVEILNPTVVGLFGRCIRCFEPIGGGTFCPNCGNSRSFLDIRDELLGKRCAYHRDRSAQAFCVYCGEPICTSCEGTRGFSILGCFETPQCRHCL